MMLEKKYNTLLFVPDLLLITLFSICIYLYTNSISKYGCIKEFEYALYAMMALLFYRLFYYFNRFSKASRKLQVPFAIGISICFTTVLYLLNTWWLYLEIFSRSSLIHMSYKDVLWTNLTYSYSWGMLRYPLAFLLMLSICLLLPLIKEELSPPEDHLFRKILVLLSTNRNRFK